jgi:hypothetical protein
MTCMVCLETDDGEAFVNLTHVCRANVAPDAVHVEFSGGQAHTYRGAAAHALLQALRHEEKRGAARD